MTETRKEYWWPERVLYNNGWAREVVVRPSGHFDVYVRGEFELVPLSVNGRENGAWLPDPPPREQSEESIRETARTLIQTGSLRYPWSRWAAEVIFAALEWDKTTYPPTQGTTPHARLHRALRRLPGE